MNQELWYACAGPLVVLPPVGSLVVYFPQGHCEQVAASTGKDASAKIPSYPNLPSKLVCILQSVTMLADPDTDEVYAHMTLQPFNNVTHCDKETLLASELALKQTRPQTEFFCKTLTASDASTHGGFSVPRRAAERIFPHLDFSMQPPAQELQARDLHDAIWKFRHIYRGQPKRHILTTGWSLFVSEKRLLAGDSVLFIRDGRQQLLLGIRRANRQPVNLSSSVLSSDSMHIGILAAAAHAAANNCKFTVFYNPWASPSEFVIPFAKYQKAVYSNQLSLGMRFRMMFETEESATRSYMGTITGISDIDPERWKNSQWRNIQVLWDEAVLSERCTRVSIWEVEPVIAPFFIYPSPLFAEKHPKQPGITDDDSSEMDTLFKGAMPWFGEEIGKKDLNTQNSLVPRSSFVQWMNMQKTPSHTSTVMQPELLNSLAGKRVQTPAEADLSRQISFQPQFLQQNNTQFNASLPPPQNQQTEQLSNVIATPNQLGSVIVPQKVVQNCSSEQKQNPVTQPLQFRQPMISMAHPQLVHTQLQQPQVILQAQPQQPQVIVQAQLQQQQPLVQNHTTIQGGLQQIQLLQQQQQVQQSVQEQQQIKIEPFQDIPIIDWIDAAMEGPVTASLGPMAPILRKVCSLKFMAPTHIQVSPSDDDIKHFKKHLKVLCMDLLEPEETSSMPRWWRKEVRELLYDTEDRLDKLILLPGGDFSELITVMEDACKRRNRLKLAPNDKAIKPDPGEVCVSCLPPESTSHELSMPISSGSCLIGLDELMNKLVKQLAFDDHNQKQLKVVPILGFPGVGKTTATGTLYHEHRGKFQCSAFVQVSRTPDMRSLLFSILLQIKAPRFWVFPDVHYLTDGIKKHLKGKRYFIILDGLWTASVWDMISRAFPDGNYGSRIVTTTQINDVALACCRYYPEYIEMSPLNDDQSERLFYTRVFGSEDCCPSDFKQVSYKIIKKCAGLPLAIVNVASLLGRGSKLSVEKWEHVQDSLPSILRTNDTTNEGMNDFSSDTFIGSEGSQLVRGTEIQKWKHTQDYFSMFEGLKQVLMYIYNNFPPHLKTCLLYLSMYPEGYLVSKHDLVRQWVAEGFMNDVGRQSAEELAGDYFDELVCSGIVQPVNTKYGSEVLSCTVHHMVMHDTQLAMSKVMATSPSQEPRIWGDQLQRPMEIVPNGSPVKVAATFNRIDPSCNKSAIPEVTIQDVEDALLQLEIAAAKEPPLRSVSCCSPTDAADGESDPLILSVASTNAEPSCPIVHSEMQTTGPSAQMQRLQTVEFTTPTLEMDASSSVQTSHQVEDTELTKVTSEPTTRLTSRGCRYRQGFVYTRRPRCGSGRTRRGFGSAVDVGPCRDIEAHEDTMPPSLQDGGQSAHGVMLANFIQSVTKPVEQPLLPPQQHGPVKPRNEKMRPSKPSRRSARLAAIAWPRGDAQSRARQVLMKKLGVTQEEGETREMTFLRCVKLIKGPMSDLVFKALVDVSGLDKPAISGQIVM